jgi:hypothetical protein
MAHAVKVTDTEVEKRLAVIERTRGMFAHVAPGANLADELVADRRTEVRTEEAAERRSAKS